MRGYRIELSEIEVRLARLADVHDAAVTAVEDKAGNTALCAYVAPQQDDIEALKAGQYARCIRSRTARSI